MSSETPDHPSLAGIPVGTFESLSVNEVLLCEDGRPFVILHVPITLDEGARLIREYGGCCD